MRLSRWLLFGMLLLAAAFVHAESGCQPRFLRLAWLPASNILSLSDR